MPSSLRPTAPRSGTPSATSLSISGMADAAVLQGGTPGPGAAEPWAVQPPAGGSGRLRQ